MKRRIAVLLVVGAALVAAATAIASQAIGVTSHTKTARITQQINEAAQARVLLRCKTHDSRQQCRELTARIRRLESELAKAS